MSKLTQGKIYKCIKSGDTIYSYWIAPIDKNDFYHLEDCLINIATGEIKHFSHMKIISKGDYECYFD